MSMEPPLPSGPALADEAVTLVRKWLGQPGLQPVDPAAERLANVLREPSGLAFAVGFVDGVMRPEGIRAAGRALERVAALTPKFLPLSQRTAIRIGGLFAPMLPWLVVPIARRVLRRTVGSFVLDARPEKLGPALAGLKEAGHRVNLNLLGEAVLGHAEAKRRLDGTRDLLARDDVDYVSIKVSNVVSQLSMWSFDDAVDTVVETLTPLFRLAANASTPKFINLDMEEYRDLDLTIAVFTKLLDQPRFTDLEAGIVLQAYLPDSFSALRELTAWARRRRDAGGAPIKVRVVKGANLAMERVDAIVHGWPVATFGSKQETDTNYKRMLDWAFTQPRTDAVKIGVAGHNLFDIAWAWLLAGQRNVTDRVDFEMLLGMAPEHVEAVRADVGPVRLYTPVVHPAHFDVAIAYLVRRLQENASQDDFMSAIFGLGTDPALFERERERFQRSLDALDREIPEPHRVQNRQTENRLLQIQVSDDGPEADGDTAESTRDETADAGLTAQVLGLTRGSVGSPPSPGQPLRAPATGFQNEPDTDPAISANRVWARELLARVPASEVGNRTLEAARVPDAALLERIIAAVVARGTAWGELPGAERAAVLHLAGEAIATRRADLVEVMASETGKTIAEADSEVSEAIDFAHYYADRAEELDHIQGAIFVPSKLTVVSPPWNFPVAIPAGGILAALAAGSGVIIKPAHLARRTAAVLVEALWDVGVPRELLALVDLGDRELGQHLIGHPLVDRVLLTGSYETAELFRSFRHDVPLLAETSGKNAIIVTPSADLDLAVTDIVESAFGHAGQKCSAASLAILVGSVAKSKRFQRQLIDATTSLRVGYPDDPSSRVGPLIEPASGKLLHALTELGVGERWLVEPKQLDGSGRLWSPGIRTGVQPGSYFHLTEFFGPVLGIMHAKDLDEAIRLQNAVDYGLTAGLQSLDPDEIVKWRDTVEAGNLYVNRGITGAIVRRQPFGGWKRSSVGAGTKVGGPNALFGLGDWVPERGRASSTLHLRGLDRRVIELIETSQSSLGYEEFDQLRRSALSDALAWREEFSVTRDVAALGVERNLFRYLPVPVTIRVSEDAVMGEALRVIAAALLVRGPFAVSTALELPRGTRAVLSARDVPVDREADEEWLERAARGGISTSRVRLVGGDGAELAHALGGSPDLAVWSHPVTASGRVELLPFLREQAISITNHRFGSPLTHPVPDPS